MSALAMGRRVNPGLVSSEIPLGTGFSVAPCTEVGPLSDLPLTQEQFRVDDLGGGRGSWPLERDWRHLRENDGMNVLERAFASLRDYGVRRTAQSALSVIEDRVFELRYETDTLRTVDKEDLNPSSPNRFEAVYYAPTRGRAFKKLLEKFTVPRDSTFVDLGSGKGKVLMLAAQLGFRRIVGVDFSPELCRIAEQNVLKYGRRAPLRSEIKVVLSDVAEYAIQDDECVFFLANPFGPSVIQQLAKNMRASLDRVPRRIWIIYRHPLHRNILEAGLELVALGHDAYGPIESIFYSNQN